MNDLRNAAQQALEVLEEACEIIGAAWAWRDGEALTPATAHQVPAAVVNAAQAIAAAEQRVREECAAMVEVSARTCERDGAQMRDPRAAIGNNIASAKLRALCQRMGVEMADVLALVPDDVRAKVTP